ncbi:MAG TPA: VIT1/CCC1 transporter family protein [Planctomycetota bacterium]|nr:VIT1/CCC1 transporter family protein [Planctomycetota bacterium]
MNESYESHEPTSSRPRDVLRHYIGDVVYGANDGIVTTFTVVSGVAGAELGPSVLLILGIVNLAADGFSMGASNFLAIRSVAAAEGRTRGLREPLAHGLVTFLAFAILGSIPLFSYLVPGFESRAFLLSSALSGAALFAIGSIRSLVTQRHWFRCGVEMFAVGGIAALAAYGVGSLVAPLVR